MKDQLSLITDIAEGLGRKSGELTGIGSSESARQILSNMNGTAALLWLVTPKFLFGNLFQPLFNIPKMSQLAKQLDVSKSPVMEFFNAYKNIITGDPYTREAANWVRKEGYIDSRIVEIMGMDANAALKYVSSARNLGRYTLAKIENSAVRLPAFIMYDSFLKNSIKDKHLRWRYAGELAGEYMVDYLKTERPMIYEKREDGNNRRCCCSSEDLHPFLFWEPSGVSTSY
jgi:hypothetical protein